MVDLTSVVRPGDGIIWGQACAEPQTLVESIVAQRDRLGGVGCFLGSSYSGIVKPEHADHLALSSYCGIGTNRPLADAGVLDILPVPYSQLGPLIRDGKIRCDVLLIQVSPPNARGEYSMGLAADYLEEWRRGAEEGDRGPEVVDLLVHGQNELVAVLGPVA